MSEYIIDGSDRRSPKAARNASIYEERKAGAKFIEIAKKYGLTVERIRQICRKEQWYRDRIDGLQPIVRCRDCAKWSFFDTEDGKRIGDCSEWTHLDGFSHATDEDGFCAWGKRRDA